MRRRIEDRLLRVVDGALAGSIFVVPLLMGGREPFGQLVLVTLAAVAAVAWTTRQTLRGKTTWRRCGVEWLLAAGVGVVLLQLVPLGSATVGWLSPRVSEILPLWTDAPDRAVRLGRWDCLSLTPSETRAGLALLLAYAMLFLVTVQRISRVEDVHRLLRWIATAAVGMAGFALVQLLSSNGKFFWIYEHPFSDTSELAKGSFTNRNHFAHFLALGLGPLVWWLQDTGRGRRTVMPAATTKRLVRDFAGGMPMLKTVAVGVVLFAGLLSLSRGGMMMLFVALAVSLGVAYKAGRLEKRLGLTFLGVAALLVALLSIDGLDRVTGRLDQLGSGSLEQLDQGAGRRTIWATVARAIPDFVLLGAGVGSHREVYPIYLEDGPPDLVYTHAENGPLQVLLETGAVGFALVFVGIGFCAFWCIAGLRRAKSSRIAVCLGAVAAGLIVNLLHSLADFVWYVPACMAMAAILAACACRLWQMASAESGRKVEPAMLPRYAMAAIAIGLLPLGFWMAGNRLGPTVAYPHWNNYQLLASAAARPEAEEALNNQTSAEEATDNTRSDNASAGFNPRMIEELEAVVRWHPGHARARLALAKAYLRRFDHAQRTAINPMPLSQIRDAALRSGFSSREQLVEWLSRAIGEHHTDLFRALGEVRQALTLCPLQGEAYLCLAELCFLTGPGGKEVKRALVDQALCVRPYDPPVLFQAGSEALLAGEPTWLDYWRRSFQGGGEHQRKLIDVVVGRFPVGFVLQQFQPDLRALRRLHRAYVALGRPEQSARLAQLYGQLCRLSGQPIAGEDAARAWFEQEVAQLRRTYVAAVEEHAATLTKDRAAVAWLEARWLYRLLDEPEATLRCCRRAVACAPTHFEARRDLARCLVDAGRYAEASEQLAWCLQRQPDDQELVRLATTAERGRLAAQTPKSRPRWR